MTILHHRAWAYTLLLRSTKIDSNAWRADLFGTRRAGILLHPTSLPGPYQLGVIDANAYRFVDLIEAAGFTVWQTLPTGPVDEVLSPYRLKSAHAGNLRLLDPSAPTTSAADSETRKAFQRFVRNHRRWLLPFALFTVLSDHYDQQPWWKWSRPLRDRDSKAVRQSLVTHRDELRQILFEQYLFDAQWSALKNYANRKGIYLFGDLPFYVDRNSVDVWWHRDLFELDAQGRPVDVAGVPPDYFSADGQLWGNPIYNWECLEQQGFRWWIDRIRHQLSRFDLIRLDHFRAFEAFWAVPAGADSAREGRWKPAPGVALFDAVIRTIGDLPLVAEDLGTITPAVHELRSRFGIPGMIVLQFAFDGSGENPYLPANHSANAVVYTGTHDNDTTKGWYEHLEDPVRDYICEVIGPDIDPIQARLITAAYASRAKLAIIPMQDLLGLGSQARMNTPATTEGNWLWRFKWSDVPEDFVDRYCALSDLYGRLANRDDFHSH